MTAGDIRSSAPVLDPIGEAPMVPQPPWWSPERPRSALSPGLSDTCALARRRAPPMLWRESCELGSVNRQLCLSGTMSIPNWMGPRPIDHGRRYHSRRSTDRRARLDAVIAGGMALLASLWGICSLMHLHTS